MATPAEIRREKLRNRSKQAVQTRDQKGLGRKSILDWGKFVGTKPLVYELRSGTKAEEINIIDFLPFIVTQNWYKDLRTKSGLTTGLDVGDWDYKLEIPVHQNVGENNEVLICNRLAFGNRCPDCETMFEEYEKEKPDKEAARKLSPSWRVYYNLYDYSEVSNPDNVDVSILENVAFGNLEKAVLAKADEGEEVVLYSDIEEGKTVKVKGREESFGGNKYVAVLNEDYVEFVDRDPYNETIVEKTVSFDALVRLCTYEEFSAIREGSDTEKESKPEKEDKPEKTTKTSSRRKPRGSVSKKEADKPEEPEEQEDDKPFEEGDGCPAGRGFGEVDEEADECKSCADDFFNACMAEADRKAAAEANAEPKEEKKPEKKKETEAPKRRRRSS